MKTCANCGAKVPQLGRDSHGRGVCCVECVFNPLGCRCKYGELGKPESMIPEEEELEGMFLLDEFYD